MSEPINDGGPVYPSKYYRRDPRCGACVVGAGPCTCSSGWSLGLTKRELYAFAVLNGLFSMPGEHLTSRYYEANAKCALAQADAMIKAASE